MKKPEKHNTFSLQDQRLLRSLAGRDEKALRELYDRYWEPLYLQTFRILGNNKSSEDVVQEVFIDLWEKRKFNHIEDLCAYLFQSVKYKTLMALRHNKIQDRHLEVFRQISPTDIEDHVLQVRELREEIHHHLNKLPPRCREVFYKSRFEHLANEEIAEQLNISKRTVETHISHALRYLRGVKELLGFLLVLGAWMCGLFL